MGFQSLNALIAAQERSSGEIIYTLLSFEHPSLATPLRFVSRSVEAVVSVGRTFLPASFDVMVGSEGFTEIPRAMLTIEGTSGQLLAGLQSLGSQNPIITIEFVFASSLDMVEFRIGDLEIDPSVRVNGVTSLSAELVSSRFNSLPFPGFNMDRKRVPGIFTDVA